MPNSKLQTPVVACSLTDAEYKERRFEMRQQLIPHITRIEHSELSLLLAFNDTKVARSEVMTFVDLEQQCCGFLNFVVSPSGEQLTLTIDGPEGSQSTLKAFAVAAGENK